MMNYTELLENMLNSFVNLAILLFEYIGVAVITYSGLQGIVNYVRRRSDTRLLLAKGLAMGLEFKLGSEILRTVIVRSMSEIYIVASIVALRAVLTILIHWEIKNEEKEKTLSTGSEASGTADGVAGAPASGTDPIKNCTDIAKGTPADAANTAGSAVEPESGTDTAEDGRSGSAAADEERSSGAAADEIRNSGTAADEIKNSSTAADEIRNSDTATDKIRNSAADAEGTQNAAAETDSGKDTAADALNDTNVSGKTAGSADAAAEATGCTDKNETAAAEKAEGPSSSSDTPDNQAVSTNANEKADAEDNKSDANQGDRENTPKVLHPFIPGQTTPDGTPLIPDTDDQPE